MARVFLSASFPKPDRGSAVTPYFTSDIGTAAASTVEGVLRRGHTLVFGGHPTISPFVLHIAGLLRRGGQVEIYQSEYFLAQLTDEVRRLVDVEGAHMHRTPDVDGDRSASLRVLRERMHSEPLAAAYFVGGMEGIADEYALTQQRHPECLRFVFTTPGGMAARLAQSHRRSLTKDAGGGDGPVALERLDDGAIALNGRGYAALAAVSLDLIDPPS